MQSAEQNSERLSLACLLAITAGIAVAITVARAIEHLRFPADNWYYSIDSVREADVVSLLVTSLYGLGITIAIFAVRSGRVWNSPGKVLAIIFAFMCVMNWGLDALASTVVWRRLELGTPEDFAVMRGTADSRGYICGIWYRNFAATIGYVSAVPLLVFISVRTASTQSLAWRLAWLGFLIFSVMAASEAIWTITNGMDPLIADWYFLIATAFPSVLIGIAFAFTGLKGKLDWWTVALSIPGPLIWSLMVALKLTAT